MVRTIIWFIYFVLYQMVTALFYVKYKWLLKSGKEEKAKVYLYKVTSHWAKAMVKATGSSVSIKGLEHIPENETVLYVSNHQGNFDIPVLLGYLPMSVGFVAKVELKKIPMVHTWMKALHCVFLDRNDPRQSIQAILKGIEYLKNGYSMVVFPEGTRSKGRKMGEFKAGSMKLALKSGVKIIPVTMNGTYQLMEKTGKISKGHVDVTIHPPMDLSELTQDEKKQLHILVQERIQEDVK